MYTLWELQFKILKKLPLLSKGKKPIPNTIIMKEQILLNYHVSIIIWHNMGVNNIQSNKPRGLNFEVNNIRAAHIPP